MLDVLVLAAHPDDAEVACGGTIALLAANGHKVGILDLTLGEMASQGDVETRKMEAARASAILGVATRENLSLPDAGLNETNDGQAKAVVGALRKLQPEMLILPFWEDRHPDHEQASKLGTRAAFLAALANYAPELGKPHRALQTIYYQFRTAFRPSFVVNVTEFHSKKLDAMRAFGSQVERQTGNHGTLISSPLSLSSLSARDEYYGSMLGVKYGEPFLVKTAIGIADPLEFFRANPLKEPLASPGGGA